MTTAEATCPHPDDQQVRTVYYLMCGACKTIRLVSYCNYPAACHPECTLAGVCVQPARERFHAAVPLTVSPELLDASRARQESRDTNAAREA